MALYALVRDGELIEIRDVEPDSVPQHKFDIDGGLLLRPYVEEPMPSFNARLENLNSSIVITPEQVTKTWSVTRIDLEDQKAAVKDEAQRRITSAYPQWKQANMTARSIELQDILRVNGSWTEEEQAEYDLYKARWAWIKAVRECSNAIEAMDPIPSDFYLNDYWVN